MLAKKLDIQFKRIIEAEEKLKALKELMSIEKVFDIQNKNIIIAGSNNGIGKDLSKRLKKTKANIIRIDKHFTTDLDTDDYVCDIKDQKKLKQTFQKLKKKYKKINVHHSEKPPRLPGGTVPKRK